MGECCSGIEKKHPKTYQNFNFQNNFTNKPSDVPFIIDLNNQNLPPISVKTQNLTEFDKGEKYFYLIRDSNHALLVNNNNNIYNSLNEKLELFFSLINIQNPNRKHSLAVTIINNKKLGQKTYLGLLEGKSTHEIAFGNTFLIDYFFEREQIIIIEPKLDEKKVGEEVNFILSNLIGNKDNCLEININNIGKLIVRCRKKKEIGSQGIIRELSNKISSFQFKITLTNNNIFDNNNYLENIFYVIYNKKDGKIWRPVYKSHEYTLEYNKPQRMAIISIDSDCLCNNKRDNIVFQLYIPGFKESLQETFSLELLINNLERDKLTEIDIRSNHYGTMAKIEINYNFKDKISFADYVIKGMQINLDIAIDYTQSNGEPTNPHSLHFMLGNEPNDYEKAIKACGEIVCFYDYDQLFPVYGFGGMPLINGNGGVQHCFNINFMDDPNVSGIDGIIAAYRNSLGKIKFFGPTYFAPVIGKVISEIKYDLANRQRENHYYILMILTDGIINDMEETTDLIVEGSKLPLSIIIIGIGTADFGNMNQLDGDEIPLINSRGEIRARDIVQFVEFELFKKSGTINSGTDLAEEVLKEIPRQVEEYYQFCGKFY